MAVDSTAEIIALALTFLVHVGGAVLLVWAMFDGSEQNGSGDWRGWWPKDDDKGPEDDRPDEPGGELAPLPLPESGPADRRLRDERHPGDRRPRPARRPEHQPTRTPDRTPS